MAHIVRDPSRDMGNGIWDLRKIPSQSDLCSRLTFGFTAVCDDKTTSNSYDDKDLKYSFFELTFVAEYFRDKLSEIIDNRNVCYGSSTRLLDWAWYFRNHYLGSFAARLLITSQKILFKMVIEFQFILYSILRYSITRSCFLGRRFDNRNKKIINNEERRTNKMLFPSYNCTFIVSTIIFARDESLARYP